MHLTDKDREFIDDRRRLIRCWTLTLWCVLLLLTGAWLFLFMKHPVLANAFFVLDAVTAGTLSADLMRLSAVFLPIVVTLLFFVLAVMLLFLHLAIRNERRYQSIIRSVLRHAAGDARQST